MGDGEIRIGDERPRRDLPAPRREVSQSRDSARPRDSQGPRSYSPPDLPAEAPPIRRRLTLRQNLNNDLRPGTEPSITDLSEAELADILFANYMPPQTERSTLERRAKIRAEHDVKLDEARVKKDAAIKRAVAKYNSKVDRLNVERDGKVEELNRELTAKQEKSRIWNPAFTRLKALREARGQLTNIRDFAPRSGYANQYYRSSPTPARQQPQSQSNTRPLSPLRSTSNPAPEHSRRVLSRVPPPLPSIPSAGAPTIRKRKATSPLREKYQSQSQDCDRGAIPGHPIAPLSANKRSRSDTSNPINKHHSFCT